MILSPLKERNFVHCFLHQPLGRRLVAPSLGGGGEAYGAANRSQCPSGLLDCNTSLPNRRLNSFYKYRSLTNFKEALLESVNFS